MSNEIFVLGDDGSLSKLAETEYETEDLLQSLLAEYPDLIPGAQIDAEEPRRWLLIDRESRIPTEDGGNGRLYLDHLFLDQEGIPTLVEVKRCSDTRIRREVVAQMLDYAANAVVYWPVETIQAQLQSRCERENLDVDQVLMEFLATDEARQDIWERVRTNLHAGRVRLIFVADQIPPELQRIVEFLNGQMNPAEVLAVEVKQFAGSGLKSLVPRVLGLTAQAQSKKGSRHSRRAWDQPSFFEDMVAQLSTEEVDAAKRLLQWAKGNCDGINWGIGATAGSFVPHVIRNGQKHQLFALYSRGQFEFYFYHYARKPPFNDRDLRVQFLQRINGINGINIPEHAIDNKRPTIPLSAVGASEVASLTNAFDWMIGEIRRT